MVTAVESVEAAIRDLSDDELRVGRLMYAQMWREWSDRDQVARAGLYHAITVAMANEQDRRRRLYDRLGDDLDGHGIGALIGPGDDPIGDARRELRGEVDPR